MPESSLYFREAKLVKGQSRGVDKWYVEFYQGSDPLLLQIYRPTFDLNRVKNRKERKEVASDIIELVNDALKRGEMASSLIVEVKKRTFGGVVKKVVNPYPQRLTLLKQAIDEIVEIKCKDASDKSKETYTHIANHFKKYIDSKKFNTKAIIDFTKSDALGFMDFLLLRGIGAATYNNRLSEIKILFNELIKRDYVIENPFNHISTKKTRNSKKKQRRVFTDDEAAIVGKEIFEDSIWLFRAILLENYCGVRPAELRRLKFGHFDFSLGVIHLEGDVVYKSKGRTATIPQIAMKYFLMPDFLKEVTNNFVFGAKFIPNPNKPVSRNYIWLKHREILLRLHESGDLVNIEGIELYSWKNKCITDYANDEKVGLFRTQNQVGHHSPEETMRYYRQSPVDAAIKAYDKEIF